MKIHLWERDHQSTENLSNRLNLIIGIDIHPLDRNSSITWNGSKMKTHHSDKNSSVRKKIVSLIKIYQWQWKLALIDYNHEKQYSDKV